MISIDRDLASTTLLIALSFIHMLLVLNILLEKMYEKCYMKLKL